MELERTLRMEGTLRREGGGPFLSFAERRHHDGDGDDHHRRTLQESLVCLVFNAADDHLR